MKIAAHPRFAAPADSFLPAHGGILQRKCSCGSNGGAQGECAGCRKKREATFQRRAAGAPSPTFAPPIVHEVLRTPGRQLDEEAREFMESRFHHEFSGVRVHTDSRAAESARALSARAYTAGRELVFGLGECQPKSPTGRQLLAHELAHVIQQGDVTPTGAALRVGTASDSLEREADTAATAVAGTGRLSAIHAAACGIQRDLATPLPEGPQRVQPDLTDAQIHEAIRYNSQFYNEANTRLIQNILGGPVTGRWVADNIRAIAATQEQFGLKKDGKVGADTFELIMHEQELEGAGTETENCLTAFRVVHHPVESNATPGPNGTTVIRGHHVVEARFSSRCDCSEFQYRQFIAGVATGSRGARTDDLGTYFNKIPGGRLPIAMQEDGMTDCPGRNYGHRQQPAQERTTTRCGENRYMDADGTTNQASGCAYRGEDYPKITVNRLNTGDVVDLLVQFRGEIRRNNRTIQTKNWTDIETSVTTP